LQPVRQLHRSNETEILQADTSSKEDSSKPEKNTWLLPGGLSLSRGDDWGFNRPVMGSSVKQGTVGKLVDRLSNGSKSENVFIFALFDNHPLPPI
jgi:hypothetical protein